MGNPKAAAPNVGTFKKGEKRPNQGKRGPSKQTRELKEMILEALDEAGGISYLVDRANDPKTAAAFVALIGKVLPMTVQGPAPDGSHTFTVLAPWLQSAVQLRNSA